MKPAIHAYLCDDTGHRFFGNEAETFLHKYEVYRDACSQANREIYHSVFEGQP